LLVLSKIAKNLFSFFPFLFFLSCSWLWRQWTIPANIFNSGVGKYRTNPKIRYSWLWCQWIFSQKMNLKKKFSMSFLLFILHYYLPFLDGSKKKTLHDIFAFNSNNPQIEHIYKKIQTQSKKIKQSARGPQINQRRP
jgi:hypothetical protein